MQSTYFLEQLTDAPIAQYDTIKYDYEGVQKQDVDYDSDVAITSTVAYRIERVN